MQIVKINGLDYYIGDTLKNIAFSSGGCTTRTVRNRIKDKIQNGEIIILKGRVYIRTKI